jgi:hypothetical protein
MGTLVLFSVLHKEYRKVFSRGCLLCSSWPRLCHSVATTSIFLCWLQQKSYCDPIVALAGITECSIPILLMVHGLILRSTVAEVDNDTAGVCSRSDNEWWDLFCWYPQYLCGLLQYVQDLVFALSVSPFVLVKVLGSNVARTFLLLMSGWDLAEHFFYAFLDSYLQFLQYIVSHKFMESQPGW